MNCTTRPTAKGTAIRTREHYARPGLTRREWLRTAALTPVAATAITLPVVAGASAAEPVSAPNPARLNDFPANAVRLFMQADRGCGEAMLLAGCTALGLPADRAGAMGLALSGGLGLQGKTCACVIAGAQLLSIAVAEQGNDPATRKPKVYQTVGGFVKRFAAEFGATDCRALCQVDLTIPAELKRFKSTVKEAVCSKIVEKTARLVAETIPTLSRS